MWWLLFTFTGAYDLSRIRPAWGSLRGLIRPMIVGVLIMGLVQNVMNLLNIPPFYQYLASGAILLAAVMLDRLKQLRRR
jgi:ribose/xylose/arabinose/galactoside ABC-type transport system permease subunit